MTIAAVGTLLLAMDVIIHVTTRATTVDLGILENPHMTLIAPRFPMRPTKWELGRNVMIEDRHFPVVFTVTALTVRAVSAAVFIVGTVAGKTLRRRFPIRRTCFMA